MTPAAEVDRLTRLVCAQAVKEREWEERALKAERRVAELEEAQGELLGLLDGEGVG